MRAEGGRPNQQRLPPSAQPLYRGMHRSCARGSPLPSLHRYKMFTAPLLIFLHQQKRFTMRAVASAPVTSSAVVLAGIYVTQVHKQGGNTDFTHVERLSLWTQQLHRGVALTIDLTGAEGSCSEPVCSV